MGLGSGRVVSVYGPGMDLKSRARPISSLMPRGTEASVRCEATQAGMGH